MEITIHFVLYSWNGILILSKILQEFFTNYHHFLRLLSSSHRKFITLIMNVFGLMFYNHKVSQYFFVFIFNRISKASFCEMFCFFSCFDVLHLMLWHSYIFKGVTSRWISFSLIFPDKRVWCTYCTFQNSKLPLVSKKIIYWNQAAKMTCFELQELSDA